MENPLFSDRNIEFLLYEVLGAERLCDLPAFREHGRETFDLFLASSRRMARQVLLPSYRRMDAQAPELRDGRIRVHPLMRKIYPQLLSLGLAERDATGPRWGDSRCPSPVASLAAAYLMAGNRSGVRIRGAHLGAAHLIEAFGTTGSKPSS